MIEQELRGAEVRVCREGDMARVIHAKEDHLLGEIVLIEEWRPEHQRWQVLLMEGPLPGRTLATGRPVITSRFGFRDSSLEPLPRCE